MKTEIEIKFKIAVHESKIWETLKDDNCPNDLKEQLVMNYLKGMKALLWVLSDEDFIKDTDFEKKVLFELACLNNDGLF